jgi:steroid 5-alpha reductase family enzyme
VGWQYVTLISPIFVAFLLIKVSGVKLLEISGMERWGDDPAYINYVASTPSLVPFSGGSKNTQ